MSAALGTVDRTFLRSEVTERLRKAILDGSLTPGTRLVEAELARQLGTSRGPVREAIRLLAEEGLVESVDGRGASVRSLTARDVRELSQLRAALEGLAASLASGLLIDQDKERLHQLVGRIEAATSVSDAAQVLQANSEFHQCIQRASQNLHLIDTLTRLAGILRLSRLLEYSYDFEGDVRLDAASHRALLEAILSGDAERARRSMEQHILESMNGFLQRIDPGHESGIPPYHTLPDSRHSEPIAK